MANNPTSWIFYLALVFLFFGFIAAIQGAVTNGRQNDLQPHELSSKILVSNISLTAGVGQILLAVTFLLLYYGLLPDRSAGLLFLGVLYFPVFIVRAIALYKVSRNNEAGMSKEVCLLINFLWPVLAILFIPFQIIEIRDLFQREAAFSRSQNSSPKEPYYESNP